MEEQRDAWTVTSSCRVWGVFCRHAPLGAALRHAVGHALAAIDLPACSLKLLIPILRRRNLPVLAASVIPTQGSSAILISSKVTCYQRPSCMRSLDDPVSPCRMPIQGRAYLLIIRANQEQVRSLPQSHILMVTLAASLPL